MCVCWLSAKDSCDWSGVCVCWLSAKDSCDWSGVCAGCLPKIVVIGVVCVCVLVVCQR